MTLQAELKQIGADLAKSKDVKVIEINPTLDATLVFQMVRKVMDHATRNGRSKTVSVISFVR